jgi:hypothetical protein
MTMMEFLYCHAVQIYLERNLRNGKSLHVNPISKGDGPVEALMAVFRTL